MLTVYHGATCPVSQPLCSAGRSNLDFGRGFYVTNLREQAVSWAMRPVNTSLPQWLNIYKLDTNRIYATIVVYVSKHTTASGLILLWDAVWENISGKSTII